MHRCEEGSRHLDTGELVYHWDNNYGTCLIGIVSHIVPRYRITSHVWVVSTPIRPQFIKTPNICLRDQYARLRAFNNTCHGPDPETIRLAFFRHAR